MTATRVNQVSIRAVDLQLHLCVRGVDGYGLVAISRDGPWASLRS